MIRVVVVDDEPVARRGLVKLLEREPDLTVVGQAADGPEAVEVLERERPDAVFLDIQMPGQSGMAVAKAIQAFPCPPLVVFVTAYDQYAVQAFALEAADYVLKPFDRERLRQVLDRVRRQLRRVALGDVDERARELQRLLGAGPGMPDRLVIHEGGTVVFLHPRDVDWVESASNYVRIWAAGTAHLFRDTLGSMEQRLEPHGFLRVNRSVLVNLARVRRIEPGRSGTHVAVLEDGRRFTVSRRSVPRLRRVIADLS